jgi:FkbM family methyltransferase
MDAVQEEQLTTPIRRFIKQTFPWTIKPYEREQTILSGIAPLKEFKTPYGFYLVGPDCDFVRHLTSGKYESKETDWMAMKFLESTDLFVDGGANIGLYTMLARKLGVPTISIEPQRKNVKALKQGLRTNGFSCNIKQVALSDSQSQTTMYGLSSGSSSLIKDWHTETSLIRRKVKTDTLDNILKDVSPHVQLLIKLDLEGNEYKAILGSQQTMNRDPKPIWLIEIVDFAFPNGVNPHKQEVFNMFSNLRYSCQEITKGNFIFQKEVS